MILEIFKNFEYYFSMTRINSKKYFHKTQTVLIQLFT